MDTQKKIKVNFQQQRFEKQLKEWKDIEQSINDCISLSDIITSGEIKVFRLGPLKEWLTNKTGFPAAEKSAELLLLDSEYKAFVVAYKKLKAITDKTIKDNFESNLKGLKLCDSYVKELEIENTIYLNENYIEIYEKMNEACTKLNEVEALKKRVSNSVQRTYDGKWKVNIQTLDLSSKRF